MQPRLLTLLLRTVFSVRYWLRQQKEMIIWPLNGVRWTASLCIYDTSIKSKISWRFTRYRFRSTVNLLLKIQSRNCYTWKATFQILIYSLIASKLFTNLKHTENNRAEEQEVIRSVESFQLVIPHSHARKPLFLSRSIRSIYP
jgi:hypothetical protein